MVHERFLCNRAQEANERYTTKFITSLYEEEAKGVFITRESVLGHLQQVSFQFAFFVQSVQYDVILHS